MTVKGRIVKKKNGKMVVTDERVTVKYIESPIARIAHLFAFNSSIDDYDEQPLPRLGFEQYNKNISGYYNKVGGYIRKAIDKLKTEH